MNILRKLFSASEIQDIWIEPDTLMSSNIVGYFGRTNDRRQIKELILQRYGTGFRISKDAESGVSIQSYERQGFRERLDASQVEIVSIGLGHRITSALANLFSEQTQNFSLVAGETDTSDASDLLWRMRNGNQFLHTLTSADAMSIQCGSSVIFTEFSDNRLRYRVIDPGRIKVLYPLSVEVDGRTQPTDYMRIDDAACVVINTGTIDGITNKYVAIFGRSDIYPMGRYVSYISSGEGRDILDIGDDHAWDWVTEDGQVANPLSLYAIEHPELEIPEYPISIIYGGTVAADRLLPLSDSLMRDSLEVDVAASQIRGATIRNSEGTKVLTKNEDGNQPIPSSLSGNVVLEAGQKLENLEADVDASKMAMEALESQMIAIAAGYLVPDYVVSSRDHTVEAASGVALKVRSKPLEKFRERRININHPSVYRLWEIERSLIGMHADADERVIRLLESCDQHWDAGELVSPESALEKTKVISDLYDLGVYDTIEAIRVQYGLSSESEAIAKYERLKERSLSYPSLATPLE